MEGLRFETDREQNTLGLTEDLELVFVLSGRLAVRSSRSFVLESEGLCVFNPFESVELRRETGGHILSLFLSSSLLTQLELGQIFCCSTLQPEKEVFLNILRTRLAALYLEYESPDQDDLTLKSCLYALLAILRREFSDGVTRVPPTGKERKKLAEYLSYIHDHLEEDLSLKATAKAFYISPSHLSHNFFALTGIGFSDYVRDARLRMAALLLRTTGVSVTEIAARCGFTNINTLIHSFQQVYGTTPGKYRRQNPELTPELERASTVSYMSLTQYAGREEGVLPLMQRTQTKTVTVNAAAVGKTLNLCHNQVADAGFARELLLHSNQTVLRREVKDMGYQYLFFHGILDRNMNLTYTQADGSLLLNFTYVDMVIDFVLSLGAKPWLPLDYTPLELVREPPNIFVESCVNLPDDMERWEKIVDGLLRHFLERYGMSEVRSWHFSVMQAMYEYYGVFTLEQYEEYYLHTFRAIRRAIPGAYICGFGLDTGIVTLPGNDSLIKLLQFCRENDCMPNEISFQSMGCDYQRADLQQAELDLINQQQDMLHEPVPVSWDPDIMAHELDAIRVILEENGGANLPISYSVWRNTIWERDLGNDTCFQAAWLVKNVLENAGKILMAATGLMDQSGRSIINPNVFHGGIGTFTYLGTPKAGYHALALLSRLKGETVSSGKGYFVTRPAKDELLLMLYHYCHYDRDTHLSSQLPVREQRVYDRYYGFEKKGPCIFEIMLTGLSEGTYESESTIINRQYGSSYDQWMRMGAPKRFTELQTRYLESVSVPKLQYSRHLADKERGLLISVLLEPHEVRLIHLKKVDNNESFGCQK